MLPYFPALEAVQEVREEVLEGVREQRVLHRGFRLLTGYAHDGHQLASAVVEVEVLRQCLHCSLSQGSPAVAARGAALRRASGRSASRSPLAVVASAPVAELLSSRIAPPGAAEAAMEAAAAGLPPQDWRAAPER